MTPGICANAPNAAIIRPISAITADIANTPSKAPGSNLAKPPNVFISNFIRVTDKRACKTTLGSKAFIASITPLTKATINPNTASIISGKRFVRTIRILQINSTNLSTILGTYSVNAVNTPNKISKSPLAIDGIIVTKESITAKITAAIAFPIMVAPSIITTHKATKAFPIASIKNGINEIILFPMTIIDSAITIILTDNAEANAGNVAAAKPIPIANIATAPAIVNKLAPNNAIINITGCSNLNPIANTANAPAIPIRPVAIVDNFKLPIIAKATERIINDPATATILAASANDEHLDIIANAATKTVKDAVMVTNDFNIISQSSEPNILNATAKISKPAVIITNCVAPLSAILFPVLILLIIASVPTNTPSATVIAVKLLAMPFQLSNERRCNAIPNNSNIFTICINCPDPIKAMLSECKFSFRPPISAAKPEDLAVILLIIASVPTNTPSATVIAVKPLAIPSQLSNERRCNAIPNNNNIFTICINWLEPDNAMFSDTDPAAKLFVITPNADDLFVILLSIATTPTITPNATVMATKPFIILPQLSLPIIIKANANTNKELDKVFNASVPSKAFLESNLFNTAVAAIKSTMVPPIATNPLPISSHSSLASFVRAKLKIRIANAILVTFLVGSFNDLTGLNKFLRESLILPDSRIVVF